jgi:hypothetical protein
VQLDLAGEGEGAVGDDAVAVCERAACGDDLLLLQQGPVRHTGRMVGSSGWDFYRTGPQVVQPPVSTSLSSRHRGQVLSPGPQESARVPEALQCEQATA